MRHAILAMFLVGSVAGCSGQQESTVTVAARPRPVNVIRLAESDPAAAFTVAGTVGSWKTEDIAFEVSGRVQFVIEPETNVTGPLTGDADDQPLARLDPERYQTAVVAAEAQITMLDRQKDAAIIERDRVIPAERNAAAATLQLAQADYNRWKGLIDRQAASAADLDKASANLKNAQAQVAQLDARKAAKAAEITSIDAEISKAKAQLIDAERDLDDCTVTAPFRGQIAQVHAIPGGTVQRGEPVVTLQMMDPMKVEFEVSAQRARQMQYKDTLDIVFTQADGSQLREEGAIWMTDSTADPSTRTFTITVLIRNRLMTADLPDDLDPASIGKVRDIWQFVQGVMGDDDRYYLETNSVQQDASGTYVWKIVENGGGKAASNATILKAEKIYVTADDTEVDFLGLWKFRSVAVNEDQSFDYDTDKVLGQLTLPDGLQELPNGTAVFEREHWALRPGDLVGVDLTDKQLTTGLYVPIDSISEKSGQTFVFAVQNGTAKRIEVTVSEGPNTSKRIDAIGTEPLNPGMEIVIGGVHYLTDGEAVNVVSVAEVN